MGRSQVLYNRNKGRNRNRTGRGGNAQPNGDERRNGTGQTNRSKGNQTNSDWKSSRGAVQPHPLPKGTIGRTPKDYEKEYEVLFAGRDTYLSSRRDKHQEEQDDLASANPIVGGGSICIPSLAATFESLSIERRLRIPLHVAATAFPDKYRGLEEYPRGEEKEDGDQAAPKQIETKTHAEEKEAAAESTTDTSSPVETNQETSSDDLESNLEDWLDDACGVDDDELEPPNSKKAGASRDGSKLFEKPSASEKSTVDDMLAKTAKNDFGDDNLDDWLDSVIE